MADIRRIKIVWNGATGLPGVTVFYSLDSVSGQLAAARAAMNSIKSFFPSSLSWSFPTSGDVIDSATGTLTGGWTESDPGSVTCTGPNSYAAGVGAILAWGTGAIVGGRRLKGRMFLAPMSNDQYDSTGTINDTNRGTIVTAANTWWGTGTLNVWHRPTSPGGSDGAVHVVTSASVPDKVTSLRSRRT
jgi:hypothetical protein